MPPQTAKPIKRGIAVISINRPIKVARGTAIIVARKPHIAAPIPAICPIGCMAKALIFPNIKPTQKIIITKNTRRIERLGFGSP